MIMRIPEIITQQEENTQHIKDVRDAFEKLKSNVLFVLAICGALFTVGGVLWYLAMFVFNTKMGTTNNHNDIIAQTEQFHKEMAEQRKHIDEKLTEITDSISSIKRTQAVNQAINNNSFINVNRHLIDHDNSLKALNKKWDRFGVKPVYGHKDCPTCPTTFVQSQ